jgi:hypothetical protein
MRFAATVLAAGALVLVTATPDRADACGGTFCDGGGMNPSSVDQAYETILFLQDGPFVEAHIQIAIDPATTAQKFAWVVPMPAVPEFSVGSQPLFDALVGSTSPRYDAQGDYCSNDTVAFIQAPDGGGANFEPDVIMSDVVGAFEVTVLAGGSADGVMTWLGENGYTQDPAAGPILGDYIDKGNVIVAFKLAPSATTAEVHPIVLRYEGSEPCVPLRLTAIAASDDMGVRAFLLGDARWAPLNWRHVVPNVLRIPWNGSESGYAEAIARAVDEAPDGRAFVTEYAGASDAVPTDLVYQADWDASVFVDAAPTTVVQLLNAQGLSTCDGNGPCNVPYALVVAMLRKYLPAPEGANENDFYACLWCYEDETDFADWDGPAFAAELQERVIAPGQHGVELLAAWPYLTRLYTRVSAEEMAEDPMFHVNADLPDVSLPNVATQVCVDCGDDARATLPDGRDVYLPESQWPQFWRMPYAERIETIPANGAPMVESDRRAEIDELLATWNAEQACGGGSASGGDEDEGGDDAEGGSAASQGSGADDDGGDDDTSGATLGEDVDLEGRGCACNATRGATSSGWLVVFAAALRRRRRQ